MFRQLSSDTPSMCVCWAAITAPQAACSPADPSHAEALLWVLSYTGSLEEEWRSCGGLVVILVAAGGLLAFSGPRAHGFQFTTFLVQINTKQRKTVA